MRPGRPKEFEEDAVLESAMDFFWQHGFHTTGISDLVAHLGIGRQSLYDTFGGKRSLFIRCIHHYRAVHLTKVIHMLEDGADPIARVEDAIRFFENLALDKSARGCLVANALVEFGATDEEIRQLLDETLEMLESAIASALRRAKRLKQLQSNKRPDSLAKALTVASIGMAVSGRLHKDPAAIKAACEGTLSMLK